MASQFDAPPAGSNTAAQLADITAHAALTTGVHGAGGSTLATTANITTHAAVTASVHGSDGSGKFPSTPTLAGLGNVTNAAQALASEKAAASGLATLTAGSLLVQARQRADDGLKYTALSNDTLAQDYAVNSVTRLTVTAARILTTTVPAAGCTATLVVLTSGGTSFNITFSTGFKAGAALATGATTGKYWTVSFISDGAQMIETGRSGPF